MAHFETNSNLYYFEAYPHLRWEKDKVVREEVAVGGDSKE